MQYFLVLLARKKMAGLDPEKCRAFLQAHPEHCDMLEQLFAQTKYYTKNQILCLFKSALLRWLGKRAELSLVCYLPTAGKIGSEHWLYTEALPLLPQHMLLTQAEEAQHLPTTCEVVFMDDFALSGCHMAGWWEDLLYEQRGKGLKVQLTFITALITKEALGTLERVLGDYPTCNLHCQYAEKIAHFLPVASKDTKEDDFDRFHQAFNEEGLAYPLHTEYKIPNDFGSYPKIYEAVRAQTVERTFMTEVEQYWRSKKYNLAALLRQLNALPPELNRALAKYMRKGPACLEKKTYFDQGARIYEYHIWRSGRKRLFVELEEDDFRCGYDAKIKEELVRFQDLSIPKAKVCFRRTELIVGASPFEPQCIWRLTREGEHITWYFRYNKYVVTFSREAYFAAFCEMVLDIMGKCHLVDK